MSGFVSPFDESTKRQAMAEFEETWKEYSSASAAAKAIAKDWGMGRTTLTEWLQEENLCPRPQSSKFSTYNVKSPALKSAMSACKKKMHDCDD